MRARSGASLAAFRLPNNSINFVTCHDGFTLHDLVSYDVKHNEANGENNRDGNDANLSWNCGAEGDTADPAVNALRERQAKNLLAILMLSRGLPDVRWHGARVGEPGWQDPNGRLLAFTLTGADNEEEDLHVIFNMADAAIDVMVPEIPRRTWHVALDTAQASPRDIVARAQQKPHRQRHYRASARSVVVLEARSGQQTPEARSQ